MLPKADVHNHLHLSGAFQLLKEDYPDIAFEVPASFDGFDGMMRFIVQHINALMQSPEDVTKLMELAIRSAIKDNVIQLEASVDLDLVKYFDNSLDEFQKAVRQLKRRYEDQIDFRPEIGIKKDCPMETVYSNGIACIESEVFTGVDIYGRETDADLSDFKTLLETAKAKKKKTKVHIGEFTNHRTVERAIEALEPDEIQHGIGASGSEKTMEMIRERGIRLNLCPRSNVALGAVVDSGVHPARKLYDAGLKITINTDDLLLFGATITDQFTELVQLGTFSLDEIDEIRQNAF
ncbi:MAG: amidohydrolase family protein [Eudoraea sp.]|nr:amidohydrolase family protein [Eudoraea sp.]